MSPRHKHFSDFLKAALLVVWAGSLAAVWWILWHHGIRLRDAPRLLFAEILRAGPYGPLILLAVYTVRVLVPIPISGMTVLAGSLYGPFWGLLFAVLGLNLTGMFGFWFGRVVGRHFVHGHIHGWMKKHVDVLENEGLASVMIMRLLFFPFDIVSIGCGLTEMPFGQFAVGTFLGSLPETLTFVILGRALTDPHTWLLFGLLLLLTVAAGILLRRSPWAKRLFRKPEPSLFD